MPTKAEIQKLLESIEGDDQPVELFTPGEHQEKLDKVIKARVAKEKEKHDQAVARIAQLGAELAQTQGKIQEIEENANRKGKSEIETLQMDLGKLQKAQEAWAKEKKQLQLDMEAVQATRAAKYKRDLLQSLLLEKGEVRQDKLTDALDLAELRIGSYFQIEEANGDFSHKTVHPETLEAVDADELVKQFISQRPDYKQAKPAGGGLPAAGPTTPPPPGDPFKDRKPGSDQLAAAKKAGYGPTVVPSSGGDDLDVS